MTTRERASARANNQRASTYVELWIIAPPEDIATLVRLASASGRLVYISPSTAMGGGDTRHRRYLRLRTH